MLQEGQKLKFRDLGVLAFIILIVAMLVIPLPTWLLSFLIIINITLSLLVLLTAMNMKEALDFAIFPSIILIINVVPTRCEYFYNSCHLIGR